MLSILAFTGCERRISSANIDAANRQQEVAIERTRRSAQVREGLTVKEVESILGHPTRVTAEKRPILVQKNLELTHWYYEQDGKTIELLFVDGNLQQRIPQFGEGAVAVEVPPAVLTPTAVETTSVKSPADDVTR